MSSPMISIVMGSKSDLIVMENASKLLEQFDIPFEIDIVSAHRTPNKMYNYAAVAKERGIKIIIAGAGGAAHLPGMIASLTPLPVIGVPIETKALKGVDSLLSIAQMPYGVPVATVAINASDNAALLAVRILALSNRETLKKLTDFNSSLGESVIKSSKS